jgi:hypothetical protein
MIEARRQDPGLRIVDLEALALARLEFARIATRVAPMLGLAATMIPMGPALKALGDGELGDVSRSLMVAFGSDPGFDRGSPWLLGGQRAPALVCQRSADPRKE